MPNLEMRHIIICNHGARRRVRRCAVGKSWAMGQAHRPSRAPSVRGPAQLTVRTRSRYPGLRWNLVPLTLRGRRLRREVALEAELRPEAHVNQRAHLRGSEVHQGGVTPAPLQGFRFGAGPERLHLFLDLQHDLAPEGLAEPELAGQGHGALLSNCQPLSQAHLGTEWFRALCQGVKKAARGCSHHRGDADSTPYWQPRQIYCSKPYCEINLAAHGIAPQFAESSLIERNQPRFEVFASACGPSARRGSRSTEKPARTRTGRVRGIFMVTAMQAAGTMAERNYPAPSTHSASLSTT